MELLVDSKEQDKLMSLVIYIGHSGDKLTADAARISSLESLRAFVEKHGAISAASQVHLTAKGKQVRAQTLLTEVSNGYALNILVHLDARRFAGRLSVMC